MREDGDHYRLIGIYLLVVAALMVWLGSAVFRGCCNTENEPIVEKDSVVTHDTVYVEKHDTIPVMVTERVVGKIGSNDIAAYCTPADEKVTTDSCGHRVDSIDVVQRVYSDDSTYTAYVSGVRYDCYPRLDSVNVRLREITHRQTVTVKEKVSRWSVGIQGGYGFGLFSGRVEPYLGIGISYRIL